MTRPILATPFNNQTKQATSAALPTPWHSTEEVVAVLGDQYSHRTPRMVIYSAGVDAVVYSDVDMGLNND